MVEEQLALKNRIIGVLLRDAREQAEKSKRECADALGVSTSTITALEEGRKSLSLPEAEVLAYVLDVPPSYFWKQRPDLVEEGENPLPLEEVLNLRHRIVGALLRRAREEEGYSQKDLGEVVGCSGSTISAYEYGRRPIPLVELEMIAQHLKVPLEYFLDEQEGPVGQWTRCREAIERFQELPPEIQEFVTQPLNIKYLEVAMKLSQMPAGGLRDIAEGLLDITY